MDRDGGPAGASFRPSGGNGNAAASCNSLYQPRTFLRPCVLLLLDEEPAYGYELRERLRAFVSESWDHGTIYRLLNTMEQEGLVSSAWERSSAGPQRRRYILTAEGREVLVGWAQALEGIRGLLTSFLERCGRDIEAHWRAATPPLDAVTAAAAVPSAVAD